MPGGKRQPVLACDDSGSDNAYSMDLEFRVRARPVPDRRSYELHQHVNRNDDSSVANVSRIWRTGSMKVDPVHRRRSTQIHSH